MAAFVWAYSLSSLLPLFSDSIIITSRAPLSSTVSQSWLSPVFIIYLYALSAYFCIYSGMKFVSFAAIISFIFFIETEPYFWYILSSGFFENSDFIATLILWKSLSTLRVSKTLRSCIISLINVQILSDSTDNISSSLSVPSPQPLSFSILFIASKELAEISCSIVDESSRFTSFAFILATAYICSLLDI